jgi:hypothetical protein
MCWFIFIGLNIQDLVVVKSGIDAVVAAISSHSQDVKVAELGCRALRKIAQFAAHKVKFSFLHFIFD